MEAERRSEREHVTPYIYNHPEQFRLGSVTHHEDLSELRWTVDAPRDLEFVRAIYHHFQTDLFGMEDILNLLQEQPELRAINSEIKRNEGYQKSLLEDSSTRKEL
jgi:spore coat polysaccharide biosynthesis protein SpsF